MGETGGTPAYTHRFWAKASPYRQRAPERVHLLEHHLADVGACFAALLEQPTIRRRLAAAGRLDDLDDATAARLALFAALHDIGKANVGFQAQVWRDVDAPTGRHLPHRAGHTQDLTPVLRNADRETADWFFDALGWWWDATESWDDCDGETFCGLFIAALSHHGLPLQLDNPNRQLNPGIWRRFGELDPQALVMLVGQLATGWFPAAWKPDAPPLPSAPAFQHMFLGLCNLADWIGSNEKWFPYVGEPRDDYFAVAYRSAKQAITDVGLDLGKQRGQFTGAPGFHALFPEVSGVPNAIQEAVQGVALSERLVIVESETGSGKTEAALWRFARMYEAELVDGLYFALPTRAAAVEIHQRVEGFIANLLPGPRRPPVVLAVPGYDTGPDAHAVALPGHENQYEEHAATESPWASENSKRFLAAQIAVGTVDQAMMGALQVKNAHMRAACLARNLLVVDEVHASDAYMRVILKALLDAHLRAGGYALLMSATLGALARQEWLSAAGLGVGDLRTLDDACHSPYPAVSLAAPGGEQVILAGENDQDKSVHIEAAPEMGDFPAVAHRALFAARSGAKVLVVRNTVGHAIETQRALEGLADPDDRGLLFADNGVAAVHHSRFAASDRRLLDRAVKAQLGKTREGGGRIVVGTQTLEQSLDIDADLLITDLCPVDVLLQRIGRLHRHRRDDRPGEYKSAACVVLTPQSDDLSPLLTDGQDANGLGPKGYVYEDLRILEATRRLIAEHPEWHIPAMNRLLVERATHPDALEDIVREKGDAWRIHANSVEGGAIAEGLTARSAVIRRDKSFFVDNRDVCFGAVEERIRTRLGDDRVDVRFDSQPPSPFDAAQAIDKLPVSVRWLGGNAVPDAVSSTPSGEGFTFSIGDRVFRYDRWGLRRA